MSWKTLLLASLFLVISARLPAQGSVRYLGIDNGLSNNAVTQIYQDSQGFMWFGTYDGLNRYDGYHFKVFRNRIDDSTSLIDNNIYKIEGTADSRIWVGGRKGLSIFNPVSETFSVPRYVRAGDHAVEPVKNNIVAIKAISRDRVLVGTENLGLLEFEGAGVGRQVLLGGSASYEATAVAADTVHQRYWVFVQRQGLCRYDVGHSRLALASGAFARTSSIAADRQGDVWVGTENGLFKYSVDNGVVSGGYLPAGSKVVNLYMDEQGILWIACDGSGIWLLHPQERRAQPLTFSDKKQGLSSNSVFAIYEDQQGRKWIGTLRGGVNIIDQRQNPFELHRFPTDNAFGQINNFIFSFCEAGNGNIWVGTDGAGLRFWNRQTNAAVAFIADTAQKDAISSNFITSILQDSHQDTWIGTWFGGINRYLPATRTFKHYTCFNPVSKSIENNVWVLYEDKAHRLWASTSNNGTLYSYDSASERFEALDPEGLSNLQCLAEDKRGNFWGGTYTSLVRIDCAGKRHQFYPTGYPVRCIREDRYGNFWVGTDGGGLLLFDRDHGSFVRYTDADGLSSNAILRMLEDNNGDLWLSTFNGLVRFDTKRRRARNFMQDDGLQSNQFSYKAAGVLSSGEFMFGGIRGFNIFFPDSVHNYTGAVPLLVTGIRVNNEPVSSNMRWISSSAGGAVRAITVPYEQNTISVDYAALDYSSADKISYSYRLYGWDKGWLSAGDQRTATYTRLPEGSYVLNIKSTNTAGEWGPAKELLRITVLPPWYRSWWAYVLYALSLCSVVMVYLDYTRKKERLKYEVRLAHLENEKEKEIAERKFSYFTHIAHEFRTPLTLIINPLKQWIKENSVGDAGGLTTAYRNARRLLSLVDQLLLFRKADSAMDALNITRIDLTGICREVHALFLQQAKARHMDYRLYAPLEPLEIHGDFEKIEIALFNLISNAFKFTPDGGRIVFRLEARDGLVCISVEDSGCGIAEEEKAFIFDKFRQGGQRQSGFGIGLFLVKHFITAHQGVVDFSSAVGQGTNFLIQLPAEGLAPAPVSGAGSVGLPVGESAASHELLEELAAEVETSALASPTAPFSSGSGGSGAPGEGKQPEEVVSEKRCILIVDDNREILGYLRGLFEDRYVVLEAHSGEEGLAIAAARLPDLILSDVQMGEMDGITLTSRIKASDTLGHIPVILLTAASTDEMRLKGLQGGADDYITKPFDAGLLLAKVESVLRNRNILQRYFFDSITLRESTVKVPAEYKQFLTKCIQVVEEHIDKEDFNIKVFSKAMGMSHRALYDKIKSISGQSAVAFIRQIRLRRSAVLMLREDMNINQAAFQVGMGDVKYFREQFVKTFRMTPSEYIKKYRPLFNRDLTVIPAQEE